MDADVPAFPGPPQAPRHATVGRSVESVGRGSIEDLGILRIYDEIVEPHADEGSRCHEPPRGAAVAGAVDAGAQIGIEVSYAAARIDSLRSEERRVGKECRSQVASELC